MARSTRRLLALPTILYNPMVYIGVEAARAAEGDLDLFI